MGRFLDRRELFVDLPRIGVPGDLLRERSAVEHEVAQRPERRRSVVEDLAEQPGLLDLPGDARLLLAMPRIRLASPTCRR